MTLCSNEGVVQLKFYVHLFGRVIGHSVFSSFNCNLFSIIQYLTSKIAFYHSRNSALDMIRKNRCFDLNVIS